MKNQTILAATCESQWLAQMSDLYERSEERPNRALEPKPLAVTPRAGARVAPAKTVADL